MNRNHTLSSFGATGLDVPHIWVNYLNLILTSNITRKINHAIRIDYETLSNYSFLFNRRTVVHFKLKLLKFNSIKIAH